MTRKLFRRLSNLSNDSSLLKLFSYLILCFASEKWGLHHRSNYNSQWKIQLNNSSSQNFGSSKMDVSQNHRVPTAQKGPSMGESWWKIWLHWKMNSANNVSLLSLYLQYMYNWKVFIIVSYQGSANTSVSAFADRFILDPLEISGSKELQG